MTELAKLIHTMQEDEEDIVITDRHITLDRTMRLYGEAAFKNCDFEIAPCNNSRFVLEEEASVTFENCRFVGTLYKPADGDGAHRVLISGEEDSTMSFIKCRIENPDSFICSEGAVNLHGCEIIYHGEAAVGGEALRPTILNPFLGLHAETRRVMQAAGSAVKNSAGALVCRFIRADGEEVELTRCTFDCEENGDYSVVLSAEHGSLSDCTLKNVKEVTADVLTGCTFENCDVFYLQTDDGNNEAANCRFIGCGEIIATDADFSDCEIAGLRDCFSSENTAVCKCVFRDLTPNGDGPFHIEKTQMDDCVFENITLKNDFYLIDADNDSSLDGCTFRKCRTTRDDLQLVSTGGYKNKFSRKWIEEDICSGCIGLDKVIHLEDWEA